VSRGREVVAEAKVGDFDVHVGVQQQIFRLQSQTTFSIISPIKSTILKVNHSLGCNVKLAVPDLSGVFERGVNNKFLFYLE